MLNFVERNKLYLDNHNSQASKKFLLFGHDLDEVFHSLMKIGEVRHISTAMQLKDYLDNYKEIPLLADIVFISIDQDDKYLDQCLLLIHQHTQPRCQFVGITNGSVESQIQKAFKFGLKDLYHTSEDPLHIVKRIDFIKNLDDQFLETAIDENKVLNAEISL